MWVKLAFPYCGKLFSIFYAYFSLFFAEISVHITFFVYLKLAYSLVKAVYYHPTYFTSMQSTSYKILD